MENPHTPPAVMNRVPIFPLNTVLFPGAYLPLRIFEQRYIDMVRNCSANNRCFGVCLAEFSRDGLQHASHEAVGTLARIRDFSTLDDGLLGIAAQGERRFEILVTSFNDNGLLLADISLPNEPDKTDLPEQFSVLSLITARLMEKLGANYPDFVPADLQDADWVSYRLAELLPFKQRDKQILLHIDDTMVRLQRILEFLSRLQESARGSG